MKKSSQIRKLQKKVKKLMELLHDCQWVQPAYNGSPSCAYCGTQQHLHGHTSCDLSLMLGDKIDETKDYDG